MSYARTPERAHQADWKIDSTADNTPDKVTYSASLYEADCRSQRTFKIVMHIAQPIGKPSTIHYTAGVIIDCEFAKLSNSEHQELKFDSFADTCLYIDTFRKIIDKSYADWEKQWDKEYNDILDCINTFGNGKNLDDDAIRELATERTDEWQERQDKQAKDADEKRQTKPAKNTMQWSRTGFVTLGTDDIIEIFSTPQNERVTVEMHRYGQKSTRKQHARTITREYAVVFGCGQERKIMDTPKTLREAKLIAEKYIAEGSAK